MTAIAINVEGLGKRYRLGERERYTALRDVLTRAIRAPWKIFQRQPREMFWALKDVSLQVPHGEVLGLIGRNGAGKTTLLKILSRITRPTAGYAEIYGRVGSLLEVGTGFHPELTGRENLYLSGAILGMARREINKKFDEIVAFSELEKFLDMPVKHYSSGMYIRLAFAVAAHLEPEILLVDEVLAVGDIKFQKKCLGKMGDVARAGRTVVLVSHQMNQIRRLCQRVVWMDDAKIRQDGSVHDVANAYEVAMSSEESAPGELAKRASSRGRFKGWEIADSEQTSPHLLNSLGPVTVKFLVEVGERITHGVHGVALYSPERQLIWGWAVYEMELESGCHELRYEFPMLPLKPGAYQWQVSLWDDHGLVDMTDLMPQMTVATESHQHPRDEWSGILNIPSRFSVERSDALRGVAG
jgi:ABC-type polysaccharide/polyol phosphate transport system ATPase subunit